MFIAYILLFNTNSDTVVGTAGAIEVGEGICAVLLILYIIAVIAELSGRIYKLFALAVDDIDLRAL